MLDIPSNSFNVDKLLAQEIADYDDTINAYGLLEVKDKVTGEIIQDDNNPWFMIENVSDDRLYLDSTEEYFERDTEVFTYRWIAFRAR